MLQLLEKPTDNRGYYRTGQYSLRIVRIINGDAAVNSTLKEYIFRPNPTDITENDQYPNTVQPDHGVGFYVEVNELGKKTLSIRGTTGQKPKKSLLNKVIGAKSFAATSVYRGIIPNLVQVDGYNLWIELANFFVTWSTFIRDKPHAYAMLALNTKDAEVYNVLPMGFTKTRTAARPLTYGYAIEFEVVGEEKFRFRRSWLDRMEDIRAMVNRWQQAINKSLLITSSLMQSVSLGATGFVNNPLTKTMESMTAGLQGFVVAAEHIQGYAAYTHDRLLDVANEMVRADTYAEKNGAAKKILSEYPSQQNVLTQVVPPTKTAVYETLYTGASFLEQETMLKNNSIKVGTTEKSDLFLNNPFMEDYFSALDNLIETYKAIEDAPIPDYSPVGVAGQVTQDMHSAARLGAAKLVLDREDELTSAALAASTTVVTDSVTNTGVRRSRVRDTVGANMSLSQLASSVMQRWARSTNARISPQLSAFKQWYLNMQDSATTTPLYRIVNVANTDTIYTLAETYLGNWNRWAEIALINNLQYPYITHVGGPYCVKPGDSIYIPTQDAQVPVETIEQLFNVQKVHDLVSLQDLFLGFDVELTMGGDMKWDVYDVAHIAGLQAYEQEIAMIIGGQGGITSDPQGGPGVRIGTKSHGVTTVSLWQAILKRWFQEDPRVATVEWLQVRQEGDIIAYTVKLLFVHYDSALTLAGNLRF